MLYYFEIGCYNKSNEFIKRGVIAFLEKFTIKKDSINTICRNMYEAIALSSQFAFDLEQKEMYDELEILKRQTACCFRVLSQTINMIELNKYEGSHRFSVFDVNDFVRDIVNACRSRIRKSKIEIDLQLYLLPLFVSLDTDRFSSCLLNIIVNALANVDREEGKIKIIVRSIGEEVMLSVIDNGYGMTAQKVHEYLNDDDGFGGFAILKKFSETFGVRYIIETTENGGLSVSLRIPKAQSADIHSNRISLNEGTFSAVNVIMSKLDFAEIDALY